VFLMRIDQYPAATTWKARIMPQHLTITLETLETPTGQMIIGTDAEGRLRLLEWTTHEARMHALLARQNLSTVITLKQASGPAAVPAAVRAWYGGDLAAFDGIETATGGTDFQQTVWAGLRTIPPGQTLSYQGLATRIGRPKAVRAVGAANGANPLAIIVPCHRVIGADGSLTGYGGGMERKAWLLRHEGVAV
jgi:methylated-DNA-[protein]-cysteine S-methyltransferase